MANILEVINNVNIVQTVPLGEGIHIIIACCAILGVVKIYKVINKDNDDPE